jgi:hypothetical protein
LDGQKRSFPVISVQSNPKGWRVWWGMVALGGKYFREMKKVVIIDNTRRVVVNGKKITPPAAFYYQWGYWEELCGEALQGQENSGDQVTGHEWHCG